MLLYLLSNHLTLVTAMDCSGSIPQVFQHLFGVFSLERWGQTDAARRLAELDRQTEELEIRDARMWNIDDHLPRQRLRVGEDVVEGVHRCTRHPSLVQHGAQ